MALPTPGVTPANWGAQLNAEIEARVATATTGLELNVQNAAPATPAVFDLWVDADEPGQTSAGTQSQAEAESSTDTTPRLTTGQRLHQAIRAHSRVTAVNGATTLLNYNSMVESGWYVMDSTQANAPVASTCYLEVRAYTATYVEQVARPVNTSVTYRRRMEASVWGAWVASVPASSAAGSVYVGTPGTGTVAVSFPTGRFAVAPMVLGTVSVGSNVALTTMVGGVSTTGFTFYIYTQDAGAAWNAGAVSIYWYATAAH